MALFNKSNKVYNFSLSDPIDVDMFRRIKTPTKNYTSSTGYFTYPPGRSYEVANRMNSHYANSNNGQGVQGENFDQWCSRENIAPGGARL